MGTWRKGKSTYSTPLQIAGTRPGPPPSGSSLRPYPPFRPQERPFGWPMKRKSQEFRRPPSSSGLEHGPPKHFRRELSARPLPLRDFRGRGLSLQEKSRLIKARKFRAESVSRFKLPPPRPESQRESRSPSFRLHQRMPKIPQESHHASYHSKDAIVQRVIPQHRLQDCRAWEGLRNKRGIPSLCERAQVWYHPSHCGNGRVMFRRSSFLFFNGTTFIKGVSPCQMRWMRREKRKSCLFSSSLVTTVWC